MKIICKCYCPSSRGGKLSCSIHSIM